MSKKSFAIIVIFIALAIVGCALVPLLPVKQAPSQDLPSITVSFNLTGNSARTIESEATSRIESALARISGVKAISSRSYNGSGAVTIALDRHADIQMARFEVSAAVRQIWDELPDDTSYPEIGVSRVDDGAAMPMLTYAVNAGANANEIKLTAEEILGTGLSTLKGVSRVVVSGGNDMEWRLEYDIDKLTAAKITPDNLREAIARHYATDFYGIGKIESRTDSGWIRLVNAPIGDPASPPDLRAITVIGNDGSTTTLDRLVTMAHLESNPTGYYRINGMNSVYMRVYANEDANQIKLVKEIKQYLPTLVAKLPPGYTVDESFDTTKTISGELDKIYFRTSLTFLILLLFIALVTLNLRYVILVSISLVINLAIAVIFYYACHVEIQMYSLAGITISLNLVIDNIIVMVDHYTRRHNRRVFTAILAATLTTAGALCVVFFLDEKDRLSLTDFVNVVVINLLVSLAIALFLVPALVDRLGVRIKRRRFKSQRRFINAWGRIYQSITAFLLRHRVVTIIVLVLAFGLPVFMLPDKLEGEGKWAKTYNSVFSTEIYREKIKPVTDVALGGTLRLFAQKVYNGYYWDRGDTEPRISINATLPNGSTVQQMNALIIKMEDFLGTFDEIEEFQTNIYNARRASISVTFKPEHRNTSFPYRLKSDIISKALTLGGGSWGVYGLEDNGFNNNVSQTAGNMVIKLTGYNYDELSRWADRLSDSLLTNQRIKEVIKTPEPSYYREDYNEYYIDVDPDKLAKRGLSVAQLFRAIAPTFGRNIRCGSVTINGRNESIVLNARQAHENDLFAMLNQQFDIDDKQFKLNDVAEITRRQEPPQIVKYNQEYTLCLQYDYVGSYKQGNKVQERNIDMINKLMPMGYKAAKGERGWYSGDESGKYILLLLVVAIIFFISAVLFNSLRQPFAIIFIIPISFIGVFTVFYLFKLKFDNGGFASFILLCGLTVNAAIYILNEYNKIRRLRPSFPALNAYITAFRRKIVPILLTVLSTALGFLPFIIGTSKESFWFPLATGTIGGLLMSLVGLLVYLPLLALKKPAKKK